MSFNLDLLLPQINSAALPQQKAALTQLPINVRSKIQSLRKPEKTHKRRFSLKGPKMNST